MANLTLTIDAETLKRARIKAIEEGTSVNQRVREYLSHYAGTDPGRGAVEDFLRFAREASASSGEGGRVWTREDLYEERLGGFGG